MRTKTYPQAIQLNQKIYLSSMNTKRLVAVLACRNNGSRLFGKPLQNIDILHRISILEHIIRVLQGLKCIEEIILAVSDQPGNEFFQTIASKLGLKIVFGDDTDVLSRLIKGLELTGATDLFRVTSESPFPYWQKIDDAWKHHIETKADATFMDEIIDGCGFEIISKIALQNSWENGGKKHRSEMCSLYIRENDAYFRVTKLCPPPELVRKDLRLTVDYPEDLVVCRKVYAHIAKSGNPLKYELTQIVKFLDKETELKLLLNPFVEEGYSTMYL